MPLDRIPSARLLGHAMHSALRCGVRGGDAAAAHPELATQRLLGRNLPMPSVGDASIAFSVSQNGWFMREHPIYKKERAAIR